MRKEKVKVNKKNKFEEFCNDFFNELYYLYGKDKYFDWDEGWIFVYFIETYCNKVRELYFNGEKI